MTTRTLVVIRHAKTETHATSDHARRLTSRGRDDASAAGGWLAERGIRPDLFLSSSAERAHETATIIGARLGAGDGVVETSDGLYLAGVDDVLAACWAADDAVNTLAVVGHNPTMGDVVHALAGESRYEPMPTCGVAVFDVAGPWSDLGATTARLAQRHTPRG